MTEKLDKKRLCKCGKPIAQKGMCEDCFAGWEEANYEAWEQTKFAERLR